jgi:hypothetical protein
VPWCSTTQVRLVVCQMANDGRDSCLRTPDSDLSRENTVFCVRFQVFTAVTMKNGVFWDVTPCGSCKNRRFGGTYRVTVGWRARNVTVNCNRSTQHAADIPSLPILVTLMMEAIHAPERRFLQDAHSISSQKIAFLILK